ncbi:polar amino acid ABC transporter, inner membrane subunit [Chthoniobacter flavus Ellin428]|uniref:Polar amino acid ABC transporter, inner membrane subunit n=1 Tax=Chthoniobacter flavus Ellin428 TaxID=497964 RepID=B4D0R6_9BACT|nr:amino acid ABC transporter permease [Chthoniobacter flavus]EDY19928.1 polar amino acid ABC transporter, inner membrane subunit [Chthoniobacter flavus Ellin428]TCO91800.1 amino acid ABC transporter membrane protein (PAAT family) [Chthoniobacter flavus]
MPRLTRILSFIAAFVLLAGICAGAFALLDYHWNWAQAASYWRLFLDGWLTTVGISALAIPFSCLIGMLLALARRAPIMPLRDAVQIFVELTRGTPLLVQLFIYWYAFGEKLSSDLRLIAGALTLSFFEGAYISEIFRAGIEGVGASQLETARSLGFSRVQTYRYVIFPLALRQSLPPLAGQFASIIKDSSLLSVLGIAEFSLAATQTNSITYTTFEIYLPVALGYLILTLPISLWTQRLEQRARFET